MSDEFGRCQCQVVYGRESGRDFESSEWWDVGERWPRCSRCLRCLSAEDLAVDVSCQTSSLSPALKRVTFLVIAVRGILGQGVVPRARCL